MMFIVQKIPLNLFDHYAALWAFQAGWRSYVENHCVAKEMAIIWEKGERWIQYSRSGTENTCLLIDVGFEEKGGGKVYIGFLALMIIM